MRVLTSVLAITLMLSACTKDDPPPPNPTTAATTAANPDATLPPMPAVAKEDSHRGVSNFVRHYLDVLNYAALTGDTQEMETLSAPDCTSCWSYIDLFAKTYGAGGYFKGGRWSVGGADVRYMSPERSSYVTATVRIAPGSQKLSAEAVETETGSKRNVLTFSVTPSQPRQIAEIRKGDFR